VDAVGVFVEEEDFGGVCCAWVLVGRRVSGGEAGEMGGSGREGVERRLWGLEEREFYGVDGRYVPSIWLLSPLMSIFWLGARRCWAHCL
jgi:hypothetical protein